MDKRGATAGIDRGGGGDLVKGHARDSACPPVRQERCARRPIYTKCSDFFIFFPAPLACGHLRSACVPSGFESVT